MSHVYKESGLQFFKNKDYFRGKSITERAKEMRLRIEMYEPDYCSGLGKRFEHLFLNQVISPPTPFLNNFGAYSLNEEQNMKSVPLCASCKVIGPEDNITSIFETCSQTVAQDSKLGAGIGLDLSKVSPKGFLNHDGIITNDRLDYIDIAVLTAKAITQGRTRRGYLVPQMSLDAPEYADFLRRCGKSNTDQNDPLHNNLCSTYLPPGVRDRWEGVTTQNMSEKDVEIYKLYLKGLQLRMAAGKNFLLDGTNMNKNKSPVYEKLGLDVTSSNICTEITTPLLDGVDFTCFLFAINLNHWDYIKNNLHVIEDCYMILDIMVSEYIRLAKKIPGLERAVKGAEMKRDIGLGALGFHEYLQNKELPFGSLESRNLNREIFKTMREVGEKVTVKLARRLGSPELCKEAGMVRRNVSLMCVAPNKSTSFTCGETSGGIEPFKSNYVVNKLAGITKTTKSKTLVSELKRLGKDTSDVWAEIIENDGSVKTLDFLSDNFKATHKCFEEISPKDMIDLASDRQVYIDMGQSLNLPNVGKNTLEDVYNMHKYAWSKDIKTLYYFPSDGHASQEKQGIDWNACESCGD